MKITQANGTSKANEGGKEGGREGVREGGREGERERELVSTELKLNNIF